MMTSQGIVTLCFFFASKMTKFKSCLASDAIRVYVGPKAKRYSVHEALLLRYEWFRNRLLRQRDNANQGTITIRAEDPRVFELLISWLYRKKLKAISTTDEKLSKEEAALYVDLYLRASVWDIFELENAIMDRLRARQARSNVLSQQSIKQIYGSTMRQLPIRDYIRDRFVHLVTKLNDDSSRLSIVAVSPAMISTPEVYSSLDDGNRAFVMNSCVVVNQLNTKRDLWDPDIQAGCVYHRHREGEKCVVKP